MKEPPDKIYKTIKTSLKSVMKHTGNLQKINNVVISAHKIMIHALQFMKLYLIHHYEQYGSFPIIDNAFASNIMKTICVAKGGNGRPPTKMTVDLKTKLQQVFDQHYKSTMKNDNLSYTHMNTILNYMAVEVVTEYENNIKQHFVEYVEKYVNVLLEKQTTIQKIKEDNKGKESKKLVEQFCRELRKVKTDLLNVENDELKSHVTYHQWIKEHKSKVIPTKYFQKNSLYYDLHCQPQEYLPYMFYMMRTIEKLDQDLTIFNLFPLRTNIVPKHIRIDTDSLVHILITKNYGNKKFYVTDGNLVRHQDRLWKFFFRTERKCFYQNKYKFNHMIQTDGVSCSILLIKKDMYGKRFRTPKTKATQELYMDDLDDFSHLEGKSQVGIDPNMSDLLYCTNEETGKQFRYTQDQRRKETKAKKYRNIIENNKKGTTIQGKTIVEWETEISLYNRKTLNLDKYKEYLAKKNEVNYVIMNFYQNYLYRKLKLNSYSNRQRSESRMINNFTCIFGKPEEVVIGIGDWEQKKHRKFKEPVKGKGYRILLRKCGFFPYLIYEWGTSSRCYNCHGICETFRECPNPRPWKDGNITRHGLLMCKTCSGLWNRDVNSSLNICRIMKSTIAGEGRPEYLCRPKDTEVQVSGTTSVST